MFRLHSSVAKGWARTNRAQPFCMCWLALSPCRCEPAQAEKDPDASGTRVLLFVRSVSGPASGDAAGGGQLPGLSPLCARVRAEPRDEAVVDAPLMVPPSTASDVMASESGAGSTEVT